MTGSAASTLLGMLIEGFNPVALQRLRDALELTDPPPVQVALTMANLAVNPGALIDRLPVIEALHGTYNELAELAQLLRRPSRTPAEEDLGHALLAASHGWWDYALR